MNDLDNERLNQLRNYAQWERDNGPAGKLHILDWAADEITRLRAQLAEAEGQEPVATLTVNETTMSASYHLDPLSVLPIGEHSLYTHQAPAKVPEVNFDDVPVSVKELTPEAAWICGYYAYREAMLEAQGGY